MRLPDFPDLGIGVGLRPRHFRRFLEEPPSTVSWVEALTENYLDWSDGTQLENSRILERVRSHLPVALHGVSLSIGSADPVNRSYLKRLKALAARIEPSWISDHLCWTGVDGENLHDLLPVPYTEECLKLIARKVGQVQNELGRRILLENVSSYVEYGSSVMTEWEFLRAVAEESDCGLLLDVNNVYVSSVNHGFDPVRYLDAIPAERVGQIHLAGHTQNGEFLIDTHDAPVCDEVWALYRHAVDRFGGVSAMVEWDAKIPEWEILEAELEKARRIQEGARNVRIGSSRATTPVP